MQAISAESRYKVSRDTRNRDFVESFSPVESISKSIQKLESISNESSGSYDENDFIRIFCYEGEAYFEYDTITDCFSYEDNLEYKLS